MRECTSQAYSVHDESRALLPTANNCLIGCAVSVFACSHKSASHLPLRERIPPADPAKFRNVRDYTAWKNPYLIVKPDGISFLHSTPPERLVAVESVPAILEVLPKSAWPYGLIVVVQEPGLREINDTPRIDANRDKLLR